jgi:hypothetical protein
MSTFFLIGIYLLCAGVVFGLCGWCLSPFLPKSPDGKMNVREGGLIVKAAFVLAVGCGGLLALAIVSFICAGIGLVISVVFKDMTPGKLALLSLAIGIFPIGIAMLGAGLARVAGGQVDARGASGCVLFGRDLNSLVYTLFMMHWLVMFTGGFAVFGLMSAGIWALIK